METTKQILSELLAIMEKYDLSIGFQYDSGSDMYGVTGERIVIESGEGRVIEVDGIWLTRGDVRDEINSL
jgi:hypothetical protein